MANDEYKLKESALTTVLALIGLTLGLLGIGGILLLVTSTGSFNVPLLVIAFGLLVVGIVLAAIAQFGAETRRGTQLPPRQEAWDPRVSGKTLVISVPAVIRKYTAEIFAFSILGFVIFSVGLLFVYLIEIGGENFTTEPAF